VALADLLPVAMLLLGAFLTAVSAWVVVVEMRARVRMVDALGRTGEHEAPGATTPAVAGLRPFIQIPAQVALLVVALILFAGATLIAL
jgi:membrane protein required for beta-lactamase induction